MRALALAFFFAGAALAFAGDVRREALPAEARETIALVRAGGPFPAVGSFPYARDAVVFSNREGRLPRQPRGYYREYTVKTPGARDRGARRIIAGQAGEIYYTDDHYRTFKRVTEQ
jgi:ribonuclease T1